MSVFQEPPPEEDSPEEEPLSEDDNQQSEEDSDEKSCEPCVCNAAIGILSNVCAILKSTDKTQLDVPECKQIADDYLNGKITIQDIINRLEEHKPTKEIQDIIFFVRQEVGEQNVKKKFPQIEQEYTEAQEAQDDSDRPRDKDSKDFD